MPGEPPKKPAISQFFVSALPIQEINYGYANILAQSCYLFLPILLVLEKDKFCQKFAMLCLFV